MFKAFIWVIAFLSALGAINWGFVKFFKWNLVDFLNFMQCSIFEKALYLVIAFSGLALLIYLFLPKAGM